MTVMEFEKAGTQTASPGHHVKDTKYDDLVTPQDCENLLGRVLAGLFVFLYEFLLISH